SQTNHLQPYANTRGTYDSWYYLYRWPITYPYGTYEGKPFRSAVTELQQANNSDQNNDVTRVAVGATVDLAENLSFDTDFTYISQDDHLQQVGGSVEAYNFWSGGLNYGSYTSSSFDHVEYESGWNKRTNLRGVLNYEKDLGDHTIKV